MEKIVKEIGRKNNCTFCGVFRRQALDRGAQQLKVDCIATGHNADDIAETVIMNILRGDTARLRRCTNIRTEGDDSIPRVKPLKYTYEKEIVMYAHFKKLIYFSTECTFAPNAYRGHARKYLKDLEKIRPAVIMDIIHSGMGHLFTHLRLRCKSNKKPNNFQSFRRTTTIQGHCKETNSRNLWSMWFRIIATAMQSVRFTGRSESRTTKIGNW